MSRPAVTLATDFGMKDSYMEVRTRSKSRLAGATLGLS